MPAPSNGPWWKEQSTFIIALVIGVTSFFGQRLMKEHEHVMEMLNENRLRIVILETELAHLKAEKQNHQSAKD